MVESPALLSRLVQIFQPAPLSPVIRGVQTGVRQNQSSVPAAGPGPADRVEISPEARRAAAASRPELAAGGDALRDALSPEEARFVEELKRRDQAVRAHENAHKMAGDRWIAALAARQLQDAQRELSRIARRESADSVALAPEGAPQTNRSQTDPTSASTSPAASLVDICAWEVGGDGNLPLRKSFDPQVYQKNAEALRKFWQAGENWGNAIPIKL